MFKRNKVIKDVEANNKTILSSTQNIGSYDRVERNIEQIYNHTDIKDMYGYYQLRLLCRNKYHSNVFVKALINRLIINEINVGLSLDYKPLEDMIGVAEDSLVDFSEDVRKKFTLWGNNSKYCDYYGQSTFGELQAKIRLEALVGGDVLVVLNYDKVRKVPLIQVIPGDYVQTPYSLTSNSGNRIVNGVELDSAGRHLAYWVVGGDYTSHTRILAKGAKTGKNIAWLVYGDIPIASGTVRGYPLVVDSIESLQQIEDYKTSSAVKAKSNSNLNFCVTRANDTLMGVNPYGPTVTKDSVTVDEEGYEKEITLQSPMPGTVITNLRKGEDIKVFGNEGVDTNLETFMKAILRPFCVSKGIPFDIFMLDFPSSFSASKATNAEIVIYLNMAQKFISSNILNPIFNEFFISSVLSGSIKAPGFIEAKNTPSRFYEYEGWLNVEWLGVVKPTIDPVNAMKASIMKLDNALSTRTKEARAINGTDYFANIKQLKKENKERLDMPGFNTLQLDINEDSGEDGKADDT